MPSFSLDELKAAREILYRKSGTKTYSYKGPNDPATAHEKACHCTASIIAKMQELEANCSQTIYTYVCSAGDLLRVSVLMNLSINGNNGNNLEKRLQVVENKLKTFEINTRLNATVNQWPLPSVANPPGSSNRLDLIKEMINSAPVSSPNKRKRTDDNKSNNREDWQEMGKRNKVVKSGSQPVLRGKPPAGSVSRGSGDLFEVFLYNYNVDATPNAVLKYFKGEGISAYHVRFRCHPDSPMKRFVMKIGVRDDIEKIVLALPEYTGCRWYDPVNPPDPDNRPRGFYNNSRRITGPGVSFPAPSRGTPTRSVHSPSQVVGNSDSDTNVMSAAVRPSPPPYSRSDVVITPATSVTEPEFYTPPISTISDSTSTVTATTTATSATSSTTATSSAQPSILSVSRFIKPLVSSESVEKPSFQVGSPMSMNYIPDPLLNS